ncbi:unnamed protein product [Rotaria sp. Silwood1]|nr:unnamed protein product [Rotaria sp. Silwood1]
MFGDYCAYQSENEVCYRGLIRERDSDGNAIVFKIDYGDVQRILVRLLRPLEVKKWMFEVQHLAIHCSLADLVKPINGWSSEVIGQFSSRLNKPFLYGKFINYNKSTDMSNIPMAKLYPGTSYEIHLLYYISPSHFYLQNNLQEAGKNLPSISSPVKCQAIAVQDNNAI